MDYFQVRKNAGQVIRIARGPYEGHDVTRIQIWYRDRGAGEYMPGRIVAFNSELIPGIIEGLMQMADQQPEVVVQHPRGAPDALNFIYEILKAHKRPMHWETLSDVLEKEYPDLGASKWAVYNCLLQNPDLFTGVEEDVFQAST